MQELSIEKLITGGLGLARDDRGVILVEGALPGEVVLASVREARGVRRGVTRHVLRESPERVESAGLPTTDLAHARYAAQLAFKRAFVEEAVTRIAKLDVAVGETVPSPHAWAYRTTVQYLLHEGRFAYRERRGHAPVPVAADPLAAPPIQRVMTRVDPRELAPARELVLRGSLATGEVLAALIGEGHPRAYRRAADALMDAGAVGVSLAAPSERRFAGGARLVAGEPVILERYGNLDLSVSAVGFAQVNPAAAGALYVRAAALAGRGEAALDLYGGAGGFGLHVAPAFRHVTVLDVAEEAVRRGERDAARLGVPNITFRREDARAAGPADVVIVDPPRAGLSHEARQAVVDSGAGRVVYVSCDPATWARDVGAFARDGWQLQCVIPYDFYPQTHHVEVLSVLTRDA